MYATHTKQTMKYKVYLTSKEMEWPSLGELNYYDEEGEGEPDIDDWEYEEDYW